MCIFNKPKKINAPETPEQPQQAALETDVGGGRKAEDQTVYGGTGDAQLRRSDPSATGAIKAGGAGLRMS